MNAGRICVRVDKVWGKAGGVPVDNFSFVHIIFSFACCFQLNSTFRRPYLWISLWKVGIVHRIGGSEYLSTGYAV